MLGLSFFLALPGRILEVEPEIQALVPESGLPTAGCVTLSQMLALGCLVCSLSVLSESHSLGQAWLESAAGL